MLLNRAIEMAKWDLNQKESRFYYKTSNGQWMFSSHAFGELNQLIGYSSYEMVYSPYFELMEGPTNNSRILTQIGG